MALSDGASRTVPGAARHHGVAFCGCVVGCANQHRTSIIYCALHLNAGKLADLLARFAELPDDNLGAHLARLAVLRAAAAVLLADIGRPIDLHRPAPGRS